jgi:hypothetical protein
VPTRSRRLLVCQAAADGSRAPGSRVGCRFGCRSGGGRSRPRRGAGEDRLHHQDVFEHVPLVTASRVTGLMDHQVAGVVLGPATSPVEVDLADLSVLCPATKAPLRLLLLRVSARTVVLGTAGGTIRVAARRPVPAAARPTGPHGPRVPQVPGRDHDAGHGTGP